MASFKPSSRYNSFDSRSSTQSQKSDPSSSLEFHLPNAHQSSSTSSSSRAIVKAKSSSAIASSKPKNDQNLGAMVKKFIETRSMSSSKKAAAAAPKRGGALLIPADFIAEDLKKTARKGSSFGGLHRKLFSTKGSGSNQKGRDDEGERKALTEVKANTRTLAMVLRSERELLSQNKEQEAEISELKFMIEQKNREVEKLKDLCLKQREEIKALKSAVLFPEDVNSQLEELFEKQGLELNQAKQLIPTLQMQVTSLTGQLQCLAEDLAEVKSDKYSIRGYRSSGQFCSPRTLAYDQEEASNSLEFSSGEHTRPGSPDDMLLKDLNPCLTPYSAKTKSKEFAGTDYDSPPNGENFRQIFHEIGYDSCFSRKLSKSCECCQCSNSFEFDTVVARGAWRSGECLNGNKMPQKLF